MKKLSEKELLQICRENQGERVPPGHPMTTFATTYSDEFIEAAAELWLRFDHDRKPGHRSASTAKLYAAFRKADIPACRGGPMTWEKTEYLIKRPIFRHLVKIGIFRS